MNVSKKVRFEVFKRDKFTCQYCGRKAPDVILECDHISPKSKGGSNNIINLITSCKDCNRGKRDIRLSDSSELDKQRKQLEELQERRQQIKMMMEWRKSLNEIQNDILTEAIKYIEEKMPGWKTTISFQQRIEKQLTKYGLECILDSVDIAANVYLKHDGDNLIKDSVVLYLSKISGIIENRNKPPIDQKLSYIKGICRNRFNYFDPIQASVLLNNYINALRLNNYSDTKVLEDLDCDLIPMVKNCKHWTEFKENIIAWIEVIDAWEKHPTNPK